jgi:hypothetical protein
MYEQIAANKRKSALLAVLFILVIFGLAWTFDQLTGMGTPGLVAAGLFALLSAWGSYYASDKITLAISKARPASKEEFPYWPSPPGCRLRSATSSTTRPPMPSPRAATRPMP